MSDDSKNCVKLILRKLLFPSLVPVITSTIFGCSLTPSKLLILFFTLEGIFLLAFAISFPDMPSNNFREKLKWCLCKSQELCSFSTFSYLNFYLGLLCLLVASIISAII